MDVCISIHLEAIWYTFRGNRYIHKCCMTIKPAMHTNYFHCKLQIRYIYIYTVWIKQYTQTVWIKQACILIYQQATPYKNNVTWSVDGISDDKHSQFINACEEWWRDHVENYMHAPTLSSSHIYTLYYFRWIPDRCIIVSHVL